MRCTRRMLFSGFTNLHEVSHQKLCWSVGLQFAKSWPFYQLRVNHNPIFWYSNPFLCPALFHLWLLVAITQFIPNLNMYIIPPQNRGMFTHSTDALTENVILKSPLIFLQIFPPHISRNYGLIRNPLVDQAGSVWGQVMWARHCSSECHLIAERKQVVSSELKSVIKE